MTAPSVVVHSARVVVPMTAPPIADGAVAVQVDGSARPEAKVERSPRRAYPDKPEQPRLI